MGLQVYHSWRVQESLRMVRTQYFFSKAECRVSPALATCAGQVGEPIQPALSAGVPQVIGAMWE